MAQISLKLTKYKFQNLLPTFLQSTTTHWNVTYVFKEYIYFLKEMLSF